MGETVEYADGETVNNKKELEENKNMTDDGNSQVETESKQAGVEEQHDKGNLVDDDGKTVKSIKELEEKKNMTVDGNSQVETESKQVGVEEQHDKGNLVNDDLQKKKNNNKRKRVQITENALAQNAENNTEKPKAKSKSKSKSKSKKVSFSGDVEVFPTSDAEPNKQTASGDGLVKGKRFTPEEDEIVKQAVFDYITAKGLGDEGLQMVLNCKSHAGMRNCWVEIGRCLPYRPHTSVYFRAHILFGRAESRSWTPEELEMVKEFQKKHGNNWKQLAGEIGKNRYHVKDTWRRIKVENLKTGKWTQEEYQNFYELVNLNLQMKVQSDEKKKSQHGMLRDNIPWTSISEKLTTRTDASCCRKWYMRLSSSLVAENKWSDADDYRMIGALYEMDAACIEDVDWENVLEHRPGDICLKRWKQMVKHIGDYGSKPFGEQVDVLAQRYCPDLAETREAWDNKPVVP